MVSLSTLQEKKLLLRDMDLTVLTLRERVEEAGEVAGASIITFPSPHLTYAKGY